MKRASYLLAMVAVLACSTVAWAATQQTAGRTFLGKITIEGPFEWDFQGRLLEWSKGATVTADRMTMTCDHLKVWTAKSGGDFFERIEATGEVRISGTYLAGDNTKWNVKGSAQSATFDSKAGTAVLRGAVDFRAVSAATGSVLTAQADKLIYDQKTQKFRFERGDKPVRVEFEEPPQAEPKAVTPEGKK